MGSQLHKRMLHWQPATCCIFQLLTIICYLANEVLLLLPMVAVERDFGWSVFVGGHNIEVTAVKHGWLTTCL